MAKPSTYSTAHLGVIVFQSLNTLLGIKLLVLEVSVPYFRKNNGLSALKCQTLWSSGEYPAEDRHPGTGGYAAFLLHWLADKDDSAGVSGLTCALEVSKKKEHVVTVVAKFMPGDHDIEYTSPWAGANVLP